MNYGGADDIIRGLVIEHAQIVDPHITDQVTTKLFSENPPLGLGMDLAAINIQRGRDHGLPGFQPLQIFLNIQKNLLILHKTVVKVSLN